MKINIPLSIVVSNIALVVAQNPSNNGQHHNESAFIEETNSQMFERNESQENFWKDIKEQEN